MSGGGIRAGKSFVELYLKDKLSSGLKRAQTRLKSFGRGVMSMGRNMVVAGLLMATPFIAGAKVFATFEQQMANVSTMLQEPEKHMPGFTAGIRKMSVEFGESTESLSAGLYDVLSASVAAEDALGVLRDSAIAAKAGMTDTGTAADAITTILNSYEMAASRSGEVSDWLFTIVKRGKTTFAELAPSIGKVTSIAKSAGLELDEVGAMLAFLTRNGIKTDEALTSVVAVMSSFLAPSAEGAKLAKSLGFELSSATLKAEGLSGVFKKIESLPPDAIAKLFPNVRAIKAILPITKNLKGFSEDVAAMGNTAGATGTAFDKMMQTMMAQFGRLKQAGVQSLSLIGQAISAPIGQVFEAMMMVLELVNTWIADNQELVQQIFFLGAALMASGAVLTVVGGGFILLGMAIGGLLSFISVAGTVLGAIGSVLAFLVSPIGLVLAAVVGLGAAFLYFSGIGGKAIEFIKQKFGELKAFVGPIIEGISNALQAGDIELAGEILMAGLEVVFQKGVAVITDIWGGLKVGLVSITENIGNEVSKAWNRTTLGFSAMMLDTYSFFDDSFDSTEAVNLLADQANAFDKQSDASLAGRQDARMSQYAADLTKAETELHKKKEALAGKLQQAEEDAFMANWAANPFAEIEQEWRDKAEQTVGDQSGVGDQMKEIAGFSAGTFNSASVDLISRQAKPLDKINDTLGDQNDILSEMLGEIQGLEGATFSS
ncbi:MAG: phage tail tape measure protein [Blastopirellula sp.]|nr:MAG: phage tail tape measure protein [Blastopirellula sp.]